MFAISPRALPSELAFRKCAFSLARIYSVCVLKQIRRETAREREKEKEEEEEEKKKKKKKRKQSIRHARQGQSGCVSIRGAANQNAYYVAGRLAR